MRQWLRSRLTYANVTATLALFLVLSGGTAVALSGSNTVFSDDVVDDTLSGGGLVSADVRNDTQTSPAGGLGAADLKPSSVGTSEAANNSLTGADIKDRSGVDTCPAPATLKFGPICAGSDGGARTLAASLDYCAGLSLRLPSPSEAVTLAEGFDVPGVGTGQKFWTDDFHTTGDAIVVDEAGAIFIVPYSNTNQTVCVTDPSA
jgi:hypothetical protein